MKPDEYFLPYAEAGFNAYAVKANYKTWGGKPMPKWDTAGSDIQARWVEAVKAVLHLLDVVDADTGEPYA